MIDNTKLKKKIISALQSVEFVTEKGWCGQCISLRLDYSAIADALIAAGIGDVTEWKEKAKKHRVQVLPDGTIKRLYSDEEVEDIARQRDEYKHRAEVAERALLRACKVNTIFAEPDVPNILAERVLYEFYIRQAEKELAEENNDNKNQ